MSVSGFASVASEATKASATAGSRFSDPVTFGDDATLTFAISVDGSPSVDVRVDKATVEAALASVPGRTAGTGVVASAEQLALVANRALASAGVVGIVASADDGRIKFSKTLAGVGRIVLGPVSSKARDGIPESDVAAFGDTLEEIDVSSAAFASLSAGRKAAVVDAFVAGLQGQASRIAQAQSRLAFASFQLGTQKTLFDRQKAVTDAKLADLVGLDKAKETKVRDSLENRRDLLLRSFAAFNQSRIGVLAMLGRAT